MCFLGPPGAGKSTTAQLFGRNHGYVYYEADCYMSQVNPFVDLNADDPSLEQVRQTPLSVSPWPSSKLSKVIPVCFSSLTKIVNKEQKLVWQRSENLKIKLSCTHILQKMIKHLPNSALYLEARAEYFVCFLEDVITK